MKHSGSRFLQHAAICTLALFSIFTSWHTLRYLTGVNTPIAVVTSQSMEPVFYRGDVIFVWNPTRELEVGDIAFCWLPNSNLPMVHRIIKATTKTSKGMPRSKKTQSGDSVGAGEQTGARPDSGVVDHSHKEQHFLTKGDNNPIDDRSMYPDHRTSLTRAEVIGIVGKSVRWLGWPTIWLSENGWIKGCVWGLLVLFVFLL